MLLFSYKPKKVAGVPTVAVKLSERMNENLLFSVLMQFLYRIILDYTSYSTLNSCPQLSCIHEVVQNPFPSSSEHFNAPRRDNSRHVEILSFG